MGQSDNDHQSLTPDVPVGRLVETRADARLMEKAVRQRWPISPEVRQRTVSTLGQIIEDPQSQPRARIAAARALAAMESQNQADEHRSRPERQLNVHVTPEQLAAMSDDELAALERRLLGRDA